MLKKITKRKRRKSIFETFDYPCGIIGDGWQSKHSELKYICYEQALSIISIVCDFISLCLIRLDISIS